ncbi:MAG: PfkB family carbohydrate kinase [Acidobacteriota bacterium]
MNISRLEEILENIKKTRILVVGDFFLDQYWSINPSLAEISLETDLDAHQVVEVRLSPGAAGTVTNNLAALGVGRISALGCIGTDGNGFEVSSRLRKQGVCIDNLLSSSRVFTPTYTKPMFRQPGDVPEKEGSRFDIKNRKPLPEELENKLLENLEKNFPLYDAVTILDQVQERNSGVVTDRMAHLLANLSVRYPEVTVMADSRTRINEFRNVLIKPNIHEAARAVGKDPDRDFPALVRDIGELCNSKVLMTRGSKGITTYDGAKLATCPALPASELIDIVGAGDSVTAAAVSSLAAGATLTEAACLAVLASNVTIHKIGTTGTASQEEILDKARRYQHLGLFAN